jgi:hypothetical protein
VEFTTLCSIQEEQDGVAVMAGRSSGEGVSVTHGLLMVIIVLVGFIYLTTL